MPLAIDPDVLATAQHWGLDPKLVQAVVNAEGNILRAVQCSLPSVTTRQEALEVTCRSAVHALCDFLKRQYDGSNLQESFLHFWQARWAPIGVENDPHNLNANWYRNVLAGWTKA